LYYNFYNTKSPNFRSLLYISVHSLFLFIIIYGKIYFAIYFTRGVFSIEQLLFILLGLTVGTVSSIAGVGGGFILVPVLMFIYPNMNHTLITSISHSVILLNSISSTITYSKQKRIDLKTGLILASTTVPAAILGSFYKNEIPQNSFKIALGAILIIISIFTLIKPEKSTLSKKVTHANSFTVKNIKFTDIFGNNFKYSYNWLLGGATSFVYGGISGLLGIGGGIFQVPSMVHLLNVPVHIATATSRFLVIFLATSTTFTNYLNGYLGQVIFQSIFISIGAIIGAQLGAFISNKLRSKLIMRIFSGIIILSGAKLLLGGIL
jgi:uncharacterized membrane protein YfcA